MECEIDDLALAHGLVQAVRGAWSQREGARRRSVGRGRGEVDLGLHVEAVVFLKVKSVSRLVLVVPSRWCAKEREGCRDANVKKKTAALHACMPPLITASLITCLFFFFFGGNRRPLLVGTILSRQGSGAIHFSSEPQGIEISF